MDEREIRRRALARAERARLVDIQAELSLLIEDLDRLAMAHSAPPRLLADGPDLLGGNVLAFPRLRGKS